MREKETYLKVLDREHKTTLKILKAFPSAKTDFKPADKSRSAKELAWTFVMEQATMVDGVIKGHVDFENAPKIPSTFQETVAKFEGDYPLLVDKLKAMPDTDWDSKMDFFVGPGKIDKVRKGDLLWGALYDMIHHRGQMSVYLRMTGGKVPSIYGPTADEPWA
ncbi:DinB family protein [Candidatus Zixiibacteriota bacterium]|nr:DinB family protein [candidate division Zixibacteria bacterium]